MLKNKTIIGVDLGQQNDYTVISILQLLYNGSNVHNVGFLYRLVYLYRFPLKTSYPEMVNRMLTFIDHVYPANDYMMVVDYTGVGRPVVDMMRQKELKVIALNITGSTKSKWKFGNEVSVPKKDIVSSLQVVFQERRIKIARDIDSFLKTNVINEYVKEFLSFKPTINKNAHAQFNASSGYHDDIVMSIGLATWYGEYVSRRKRRRRIISGN